MDPLHQQSFIK